MSETMKTRVLLYKAKWGDKSIIDNLISIRTWSKYSHVEIHTADEDGFFRIPRSYLVKQAYLGTCWTSTMRGKYNGTVKRDASEVLKNACRWDYIEVELTQDQYSGMVEWMEESVNNNYGYAKWDLLKFISPIHFGDHKRNICSEFVNNALWICAFFKSPGIVSPKAVYKKLLKKGYKVQSLK